LKLKLSENLTLPADAVTQTFAILAKRGAGKTYTASVLAEELLKAKQQVLIVDPTGAWWGLRASADGRSEGFPILVAGGDHADIPLDEHAGETMAQAAADRFSAVLDLSGFRKGQSMRFMTGFLEALYRLNRLPCHVIVDEADTFAPQRLFGDEARVCGAMEDLVKKGRIRGLGCTLITQRPAVLNKNVLTQCESLFALRMTHPKDIDAIREWVGVHSTPDEAAAVIESLPSLPIGEAWFWSPGWMQTIKRVKIRARDTFDSSATPKAGERRRSPKQLAEIDLNSLGEQIKAAAEQAKQNDPRELRRQLADAQAELKKLSAAPQAKVERVEVPALKTAELARAEKLIDRLFKALGEFSAAREQLAAVHERFAAAVAKVKAPAPISPARVVPQIPIKPPTERAAPPAGGEDKIGGGLSRMLIALAQRPQGLSARQLGVRAGLSSGSGTFGTYLARARVAGWIAGDRERLQITEMGLSALGPYDPLPAGAALLAYWLRELGGGEARMLQALADVYPRAISKTELGEAAGLSAGSGTFGTYLSRLRTLELAEGRNEIRASEELFT
jgi:hypothetical protein